MTVTVASRAKGLHSRVALTSVADNLELEDAGAQPSRRLVGQLDDPDPFVVGIAAQRHLNAEHLLGSLEGRHRLDSVACKDGFAIHLLDAVNPQSSRSSARSVWPEMRGGEITFDNSGDQRGSRVIER
ncbi:hypothetical protein RFM41_24700 [Mesorhizobium sp. VK25A]|uniref:Uncharacterized protein n=1 Tax=Mesorhizobium vachelliae TaxID=3072309 RepID=A0ABU5ACU7_9HYPH|nr:MULTISPECIES: hypothetical protein [unclassified Mesorhizobium]MDX8534328.1 hypothetical protein [Mesorhizobium sp. VK25D]MDX8546970.1 hypothetical protein [Mesorhizobium sp. VK25A]